MQITIGCSNCDRGLPCKHAPASVVEWLSVRVDEDGVVTVHDVIDGHVSAPFETVGSSAAQQHAHLSDAIRAVMQAGGHAL